MRSKTSEAKGEEQGRGAAIPRRNRISDQSSLVGVRGTESLAAGCKAFFQLETGFKPDQNDTTFAARNSAVGLQCRWGSALLGRWDTPFKAATLAVDPFGDLTLGGITAALNGSGVPAGNGTELHGTFDRRDQYWMTFWSPAMRGISIRLSHSVNEARNEFVNPRRSGASAIYAGGPIYLGYAYDEVRDGNFGGATTLRRQTGNAVFARLDLDAVRFGVVYEEFSRDGYSKQKAAMANVVWTLGSHQLIYQYQAARDGGSLRTVESADSKILIVSAQQPRCHVHALAYQYNFSRRTFLLAQYVTIDNNSSATCDFGSNPIGVSGGQDPRGAAVGLRHIF
jgi:predicted porin